MNTTSTLGFKHFLFLWFGAAVSVPEILAGGLLAPLGLASGATAILAGHLIGTTLLALVGLIGFKERVPAIESTRISFGAYGARLFALLNVLQLIGWTTIMILSAARSVNEITRILFQIDNTTIWSVTIGTLILLWVALGRESGWKKLNMAAVWLLFGLTVVLSWAVLRNPVVAQQPAAGMLNFTEAIELSIAMPLSWLPLAADYTRFARSGKSAAWGSFIGYFTGSCWMYLIGLGVAVKTGNADPAAVMLAANLGLAALGIVILATITTTFMDAYSAGVSIATLCPGLNEKHMAMAVTLLGAALALIIDMEQYISFLLAIGSVFAPLFAILLTDYFILKNRRIRPELQANWSALAVWCVGIALYYQFLDLKLALGATIPVIIVTAFIYTIVGRFANTWTYCKQQPKPSQP
ncbi:MAG: hydroxymethylpyrimidine transporter CytX [Anaerosporomusa subterranea]|jgi:putative hydroxymethylpyrimidine transporter CytX|nr:hydroxymethylpyrimidine transporter CytX [Anaerosporomusa subterranea]